MKILSISHAPWGSTYGAATSLRLHWQSLSAQLCSGHLEVDLWTRCGITEYIRNKFTVNDINSKLFKQHRQELLPYSLNHEEVAHKVIANFKEKLVLFINYLIYRYNEKELLHSLSKNCYHMIHLNSVALAGLSARIKQSKYTINSIIVMHVREFVLHSISNSQKKEIESADYFICIDEETRKRLMLVTNIDMKKVVVLSNPVFTDRNKTYTNARINKKENRVVCAIVGALTNLKGVVMVCQSFVKSSNENIVLYVVGKGPEYNKIKKISKMYPDKVIILGEIQGLNESGFYNVIDILIRGDDTFRIGRTVHEALCHNLKVMLPGVKSNIDDDAYLGCFSENVIMYKPNGRVELTNAFDLLVLGDKKNKNAVNENSLCGLQFYSENVSNIYSDIYHSIGSS